MGYVKVNIQINSGTSVSFFFLSTADEAFKKSKML